MADKLLTKDEIKEHLNDIEKRGNVLIGDYRVTANGELYTKATKYARELYCGYVDPQTVHEAANELNLIR